MVAAHQQRTRGINGCSWAPRAGAARGSCFMILMWGRRAGTTTGELPRVVSECRAAPPSVDRRPKYMYPPPSPPLAVPQNIHVPVICMCCTKGKGTAASTGVG